MYFRTSKRTPPPRDSGIEGPGGGSAYHQRDRNGCSLERIPWPTLLSSPPTEPSHITRLHEEVPVSVVLTPAGFALNIKINPLRAYKDIFRQLSQYTPFGPPSDAIRYLETLEGTIKSLIINMLGKVQWPNGVTPEIDDDFLKYIQDVLHLDFFTKLEGATIYASFMRTTGIKPVKVSEMFGLGISDRKILTAMMKPDLMFSDGKVCSLYSLFNCDNYYCNYDYGTIVLKNFRDIKITCIQEIPYSMTIENCRNVDFSSAVEGGVRLIIRNSTDIDLHQLHSFSDIKIHNSKYINLDSLIVNTNLEMFNSTDVSAKKLRSIDGDLAIEGCDLIDLPLLDTCKRLTLTMPSYSSINMPNLKPLVFVP